MSFDISSFIGDWYYARWLMLFMIFCFFYFSKIYRFTGLMGAAAISYSLGSAFITYFLDYQSENPDTLLNLRKDSALGALQLLIPSLILFINPKPLQKFFGWLFLLALGWTYVSYFCGLEIVGLGVNTSLNATLLAILFAFYLRANVDLGSKLIIGILTFAALILFKTSMGVLAFSIGLIVMLMRVRPRAAIATALIAILGFFALDLFYYKGELSSVSSRDHIWRLMQDFLERTHRGIWGTGWGTFPTIGPIIQKQADWHPNGYYLQAHSDILQLEFEVGLVGVLLWMLAGLDLFIRSWKSKNLMLIYFFTAFAVSMAGNMPLHLPLEVATLFLSIKILSLAEVQNGGSPT